MVPAEECRDSNRTRAVSAPLSTGPNTLRHMARALLITLLAHADTNAVGHVCGGRVWPGRVASATVSSFAGGKGFALDGIYWQCVPLGGAFDP
ncbi:Piso0_000363 [Millerozyma farinosa CBS 7064]|uniref:Piso0_000363 protein n=1 Tax=Pichia sorbitophila (strain ATCC MYA-4447 / BCRC 22081 / CBS 7064 / NBRC 10061 / NRRL Y-12695) TaxID=559304 RepID=G8YV86_PICSO|nr:Piso0_000363 [Millerozyma farinosa CBS 7064]CCE73330.1 Piso0_000363 [Millerozyma farinosa CBS 7064]